jgi:hypothetical protein
MSSDTSRLLSSQSRLALTTARSHDQQGKALADTRRHRRVFMAICLLAVLWGQRCTAQINEASVEASSQAHDIQTVFVILMENHNWTGDMVCPIFCTSLVVSVAQLSLSIDSRSRGCGEVGSA